MKCPIRMQNLLCTTSSAGCFSDFVAGKIERRSWIQLPLALQVGPETTRSGTQCLCNHLTFFGSSFFVMPNSIDVSKTVELFATFVDNPVVVTTVGCIFLVYALVLIWARRKDVQDDAKVSRLLNFIVFCNIKNALFGCCKGCCCQCWKKKVI